MTWCKIEATEIYQIQHTHIYCSSGDVIVNTQTILSTYTSILDVKTAGLGMRDVTLMASSIGRAENSCERYGGSTDESQGIISTSSINVVGLAWSWNNIQNGKWKNPHRKQYCHSSDNGTNISRSK